MPREVACGHSVVASSQNLVAKGNLASVNVEPWCVFVQVYA